MVTGRIASEIVSKAAMAGVPVLASLSMASDQGARAARAASFSRDVGDSVGETRRSHMRQIHLGFLVVGLLLVAATAQAGEMLTLVKNQICTPLGGNSSTYCETYMGFRIAQGMDRDSAIASIKQYCEKIADATESNACKKTAGDIYNNEMIIYYIANNAYCRNSGASTKPICDKYWVLRIPTRVSRSDAYFSCLHNFNYTAEATAECANQTGKDK